MRAGYRPARGFRRQASKVFFEHENTGGHGAFGEIQYTCDIFMTRSDSQLTYTLNRRIVTTSPCKGALLPGSAAHLVVWALSFRPPLGRFHLVPAFIPPAAQFLAAFKFIGDKFADFLHHSQKPVNLHTRQSRDGGQAADFDFGNVEKNGKENTATYRRVCCPPLSVGFQGAGLRGPRRLFLLRSGYRFDGFVHPVKQLPL